MLAIETKNLSKEFNGLKAVDGISFNVNKGEIFGLLGPNGAGKTTTIKMLATLLDPTRGEAKVWGFDIKKQKNEVRNSIGIVFQEPALDNRLTGRENLDFHARLYSLDEEIRKKRIEEVLEIVELKDKADVIVENYSGGMQRRLEIARGLMHYPKVLFLDEPTLGLDTQTRHRIWDYILSLNKKEQTTIILTTHYMEEVDYLCQRIAIIDFGKIVALDTPSNLKNILGGDVISIETTLAEKAFLAFQKLSWVKKITQHDGMIDLNCEHGEEKIPLLMEIDQKEAGFEIKSINLRKPTLEDVFLHFTGRTIREIEASQIEKNKRRI
ncbi:MAG TPA: ATP-binding cassette domain-containing protein [Candidatus Paceibacterota bacterium]|nr:ATP-binding cassette domain-containing protein [Candidatus Paceibacterota bacterium]HRS48048.1 ATP-binding cassette domain-containing protein [Candidatus Paceibacterota bacterium]